MSHNALNKVDDVIIITNLIDFALQDQLRSLLCLRNDAETNRTVLLPEEHKNQANMSYGSTSTSKIGHFWVHDRK